MTLSLDVMSLGVPEVKDAREFYTATFAPTAEEHGGHVNLDLHGTGQLALYGNEALAADAKKDTPAPDAGFRGYVMTFIVKQPTEVKNVVDAAVQGGATVLKPAKKSLFGAFSAVYRAPDGSIWKVAAPHKKDKGPVSEPAVPTETAALLGVADMKAAKSFYEALGMKVDKDYKHYADFHPDSGTCRLGLMPRGTLAKDAGVEDGGATGFAAAVLHRRAGSREEVDATLTAAASAGGGIAVEAGESEDGYSGHFTDPDGFLWKVTAA
ncbi:Glyoxalase/bleomycin resistance protein/dioxygenase [Streptomyces xiamenensis]|uniref:Glyoxalase/bleomycin resistance protein/dioxygenase n=1 Tax=Streptomyces xiamenensis TaxID=408015 RepID=A0A0F7FWI3_9ACTN|nr:MULTISPECIES: VOC family protein [Streptomyces]AKG44964.1 Glyoxalase/bleomycin resistance protein/dioxygenase [Streptomyces xiamenensis]